jgi:hypothetical protein
MSTIEVLANQEYKYGFVTDIESDMIPRGLTEETVRLISAKRMNRTGSCSFVSKPIATG